VLKKDWNFRPQKPHYVQELTPEVCDRRMEYGELMLGWHGDWPKLCENTLWSNEAVFHIGGFVNRPNCHYWAAHDPEVTVEKMQNRPKVTVWCGMTATMVIGPYLLRDTMNAERCLQMMEDYAWPIVSGWENIDELVCMQDGAPPHFALSVCDWLDQKFLERWLGRRGTHEWPARSPDLTPCDFFPVGLGKGGGVPGKTSHNGTTGRPDSERYHQRPTRLPAEDCGFHPGSFEEAGGCRRYLQ